MEYKNIFDHLVKIFGSLTLRERALIAQLYEDGVEDLVVYNKAIQDYRKGNMKANTRIIKGSKDNNYMIEFYDDKRYYCSCPQFQYRLNKDNGKKYCKHIIEFLKRK